MRPRDLNDVTDNNHSNVQEFYKNTCIFITGGSGFLGHLLIQKLVRHCPDISRIYLLARPKKGKSAQERIDKMFENVVFEKMKTECPEYKSKIKLVFGDLQDNDLGLNEEDIKTLSEEVDIIFHLAATIKFDEKIRDAVILNTRATRDLVKLAKNMKKLKAFVHCSTAFSNYPQAEIDEKFYDMPYTTEKFLEILEVLNDEELECLTPKLISEWPNTYTFSKALGESIIRENGQDLPITIVRPSIVTSTESDPLDGWVNSLSGVVGLSYAGAYGLLRVMRLNTEVICNFIPGDYVINNMIVAGQYIGTTFNNNKQSEQDCSQSCDGIKPSNNIPIFNCTSSLENPLKWGQFKEIAYNSLKWAPYDAMWYFVFITITNYYYVKILQFVLHTVPAHIIDSILAMQGKKRRLVKIIDKINYYSDLLANFTCKDKIYLNYNNQVLWKTLNTKDQKLFKFSIKDLNWGYYFLEQYGKGIYLYVSNSPPGKLQESRTRYQRLKYLHYFVVYSFYALCAYVFFKFLNIFL